MHPLGGSAEAPAPQFYGVPTILYSHPVFCTVPLSCLCSRAPPAQCSRRHRSPRLQLQIFSEPSFSQAPAPPRFPSPSPHSFAPRPPLQLREAILLAPPPVCVLQACITLLPHSALPIPCGCTPIFFCSTARPLSACSMSLPRPCPSSPTPLQVALPPSSFTRPIRFGADFQCLAAALEPTLQKSLMTQCSRDDAAEKAVGNPFTLTLLFLSA